MKERENGLDLLRCVAFFFVVLFHSFLNNGYTSEPQTGLLMITAGAVRWMSVSCIGLYVMLSGYLRVDKKISLSYFSVILRVLMGYFLVSLISIPVRNFLLGDTQTVGVWLKRLFSFSACVYGWYVPMFIGLMLISPVVNLAVNSVKSDKLLITLTVALFLCTAFTRFTVMPKYWKIAYPLSYYFAGAAMKKFKPEKNKLACAGAAVGWTFLLSLISTGVADGDFSTAIQWEFGDIQIVLLVIAVFICIYKIRVPERAAKVLRWIGAGSFEGYLVSHLFDSWLYKCFPQFLTPEKYIVCFFVATVPVFIMSAVVGHYLDKINSLLLRPAIGKMKKYDEKHLLPEPEIASE